MIDAQTLWRCAAIEIRAHLRMQNVTQSYFSVTVFQSFSLTPYRENFGSKLRFFGRVLCIYVRRNRTVEKRQIT